MTQENQYVIRKMFFYLNKTVTFEGLRSAKYRKRYAMSLDFLLQFVVESTILTSVHYFKLKLDLEKYVFRSSWRNFNCSIVYMTQKYMPHLELPCRLLLYGFSLSCDICYNVILSPLLFKHPTFSNTTINKLRN